MASLDSTNIRTLRPTSTERVKRFRQRQRAKAAPVAAVSPPAETQLRNLAQLQPGVTLAAFGAALGLATISGSFSVDGLTAIFVGAFVPVIAMGVALECGKLAAVAWLSRYGRQAPRALSAVMVVLIAALMILNAIGAYGFLSRAHIEHALVGEAAVAGRVADVDAQLTVQRGVVADLDRQIAQVDSAVEETTRRGHAVSAMNLAEQQRRNRADLVAARARESATLVSLQVERAAVEGARAKAAADLGPVKYLSAIVGVSDDVAMRAFILAVALLLDPAAVILLLAASRGKR